MTILIHMEDSYAREFEAVVEIADGNRIVLDRTAFSPRGGGLPSDTGFIFKGEVRYEVAEVLKQEGVIRHILKDAAGLASGDGVRGEINWERRYALMRMHTASHLLAATLNREHGVLITGNQVDTVQTRMDFNVERFDRDLMNACVEKTNLIIARDIHLKVYSMEREKAFEIPGIVKIAKGLPPEMKTLRIVEIGDADIQADGGVHVAHTAEIGKICLLRLENKGKTNRRIYFTLSPIS